LIIEVSAMNVLVAEDDTISQRILRNYLEKWGYQFVIVEDGAAAWDLLQKQDFAIVLTDWIMPTMDGPELIRRIRQREQGRRTVFAILLTSKSEKESLVEALEGGADDFLTKPFDRDELRLRLRAGERVVRLERALAEYEREVPSPSATADGPGAAPVDARRIADELATLLDEAATGIAAASRGAATGSESRDSAMALVAVQGQLDMARALVDKLRRGS
jgi:CheY-like chemotaxis protein